MGRKVPLPALIIALTFCVCCTLEWLRPSGADVAVGEEHEMAFPADQTMELVEGVLRGEGILFDVLPEPDKTIQTLWKPADNPAGFFSSMAGMKRQYRYEITVIPEGGARSRVIVNVRTEYVPAPEVDKYKASRRFNLFQKLD